MRISFISILAAVAFSAHAGEQPKNFNYASQVGMAEINVAAYGCLTIPNNTLQEGESITLITVGDPQKIINTTIRKKLTTSCSKNAEQPPNATFYSFRAGKELMAPSFAIVRFNGNTRVVNDTVRVDLNGDGLSESFRSCAGNEGLHLTIWAGEPLKTRRLWHEYFSFGYDTEPTCTPKDYGE